MNFHDNSKNKNRKIDFSFVFANCASSIKMGSKLRGRGGGSAYPWLGKSPNIIGIIRNNYLTNFNYLDTLKENE